jgi:hypothetical protein
MGVYASLVGERLACLYLAAVTEVLDRSGRSTVSKKDRLDASADIRLCSRVQKTLPIVGMAR